ncbi:hypothetical protein [Chloroflexus aurantiacus]|nr:hypothetical protein [Chloroflexus aurantiacus]
MAAALQTPRHTHNERVRQPIQRVMAPPMDVSPPRCHPSRLGVGYDVVGN